MLQKYDKVFFKSYIEYEPDLNFIMNSLSIKIEEAIRYLNSCYIVTVFGYPNVTLKEGVNNILEYDQQHDWTYIESVEIKKNNEYIYKIK